MGVIRDPALSQGEVLAGPPYPWSPARSLKKPNTKQANPITTKTGMSWPSPKPKRPPPAPMSAPHLPRVQFMPPVCPTLPLSHAAGARLVSHRPGRPRPALPQHFLGSYTPQKESEAPSWSSCEDGVHPPFLATPPRPPGWSRHAAGRPGSGIQCVTRWYSRTVPGSNGFEKVRVSGQYCAT